MSISSASALAALSRSALRRASSSPWTAHWRPCSLAATPASPISRHPLSHRLVSTLTQVPTSGSASREVPTPVVFISAPSLSSKDTKATDLFKAWTSHLSAAGYHSILLDVDPDAKQLSSCSTTEEALEVLEGEATRLLQGKGKGSVSPFPPILIAHGKSTLLAETYVGSHPLSALVLLDPPTSPDAVESSDVSESPLKTQLDPEHFYYEVRFPAMVGWSSAPEEMHRIEQELMEDGEIDERKEWDVCSSDGAQACIEWLEEDCGVADDAVERAIEADEDSELEGTAHDEPIFDPANPPDWFTQGLYVLSSSRKMPMTLDESHLIETFIKGRGPGGQAVNKTSSCVSLVHKPTGWRISCQEHRSRDQNRKEARRRMARKLEALVRGEESVEAKEREKMRRKKRNKEKKGAKKRSVGLTEAEEV